MTVYPARAGDETKAVTWILDGHVLTESPNEYADVRAQTLFKPLNLRTPYILVSTFYFDSALSHTG